MTPMVNAQDNLPEPNPMLAALDAAIADLLPLRDPKLPPLQERSRAALLHELEVTGGEMLPRRKVLNSPPGITLTPAAMADLRRKLLVFGVVADTTAKATRRRHSKTSELLSATAKRARELNEMLGQLACSTPAPQKRAAKPQTKTKSKSAPAPKNGEQKLALAAARVYHVATGNKPTLSAPRFGPARGPFIDFVSAVFAARNIEAKSIESPARWAWRVWNRSVKKGPVKLHTR